jgi:hypothetical protein
MLPSARRLSGALVSYYKWHESSAFLKAQLPSPQLLAGMPFLHLCYHPVLPEEHAYPLWAHTSQRKQMIYSEASIAERGGVKIPKLITQF